MLAPLPVPIIAVVGSRKSGKTTTAETVVRELTRKGYRVATAKHIHESNFTIDAKGKDTYRHIQAGAHITIGVARSEVAIIKRTDTTNFTLHDVTQNLEDGIDLIILEGFRILVAQDQTVLKIVTVKSKDEINEATQVFKPIIAITGPISETEAPSNLKIPCVDIKKEPHRLAEIIYKRINPIILKRREAKETLTITIDQKLLPLNPYVQKVTRNVLFAVVSTLKGAAIKGNEKVSIKIEKSRPQ